MTDAAPQRPAGDAARATAAQARAGDGDVLDAALRSRSPARCRPRCKIGATLIEKGVAIWQDPAKAVALAEQGGALTAELAKLALMRAGFADALQGQARDRQARRVGASRCRSPRSRRSARRSSASVNDVLLSCVAGALRDYLVDKGDAVARRRCCARWCRSTCARWRRRYKLGNQFGLVFLDLPIGIENPVERLYAVRANMNALKGSYQPVLALGLLAAMGAGPKAAAGPAAAGALAQRDGGDDQRARAAGAALPRRRDDRQHDVLGAAVGRHRHGRVDPLVQRQPCSSASSPTAGSVPDPERVIARFAAEFEKLVLTTLMAPPRTGISIRPSRQRGRRRRAGLRGSTRVRARRGARCASGPRRIGVRRPRTLPSGTGSAAPSSSRRVEPLARRAGGSRPTGRGRSARG